MSREELILPSEIRSVTLADLQFDPPSPHRRLVVLAKAGLMLWGALTFGASIGTAAFYFVDTGGGEPAVVSDAATAQTLDVDAGQAALAEVPPHLNDFVGSKPAVAARLPRPRPDEPVFTGSVESAPTERAPLVRARAERPFGPCEALNQIGASFAFNIRCERQAYAPPPRVYYDYGPRPYHPPVVR